MDLKGKKVAILGYGIEGHDAEKFLKTEGAEIEILDAKHDENYLKGLDRFDLIVRSPGIYRYLPELVQAQSAGVVVSSGVKIFLDLCQAKVIGVTGTKGKGTTATLIYEILKGSGKDVYLAGNIGKPYLELLDKITKDSFVVLEMSSFQLIDVTKSPNVAVVLNITQDHLDWHKDENEYVNAKKNIVRYQLPDDVAIVNEEYETSKSFAEETKAKVVYFSKNSLDKKYTQGLLLKGEHNLENVAAAVSVANFLEIEEKIILKVLQSFKGLEHRLELVGSIRGVTFYNDSFATGPQPTIAAIRSFEGPETLILGGSEKGLDYSELAEVASQKTNVKNIVLIGAIKDRVKEAFVKAGFSGKVLELTTNSMDEIVRKAYDVTPEGGVVLLSPAAASFDMFENYKERGKRFKESVLALK